MAVGDVLTDEEMAARSGATAARPSGPPPDVLSDDEMQQRLASSGPSMLQSFGRGALEGATFGFEDELGLADRRRQAASREANPWTHFMGEVAGGLAPMALAWLLPGGQPLAAARTGNLLYRGANLARRALLPGEISTLAQAVGQGAKLGAVYGGLSGAGHANPADTDSWLSALGQRAIGTAKGAAVGTLMGGPLGGVLYGGSRLLGAVINRAMPNLRQVMDAASLPEQQGIRDVLRNMGYDKYTTADLEALRRALADPAQAPRYAGLNLIEALETRALQAAQGTGELRPPPVFSPNLRMYARDVANTEGAGRHEAVEAFGLRQHNMPAAIMGDVDRMFGAAPASLADDVATLSGVVNRLTGAGDRAAVEAQRLAQREIFNRRYDSLRSAPLQLNEGLGDLFYHPTFRNAVAYAANNDIIATPGSAFGKAWSAANTQGLEFRGAGITLSPGNILDINHSLVLAERAALDPQGALIAGTLKKRFADWVGERLKKYPQLQSDYAMFKRAIEAEEVGAKLPLVAGGRGHPSMQFIRDVNRDAERAAAVVERTFPRSDKSLAAWRAGELRGAPELQALRGATAKLEAAVEVRDSFRRAWGEAINEQLSRTTDPRQVARIVSDALSPAGRERITTVLGPQQAGEFIQELTLLQARNQGMSLSLRSGGGDNLAMQFLAQAQREGNIPAITAFRRGWGERIRDELRAASGPAQVTAIVRQLLSAEGKNRILRILGPTDGRQFIESLYNKLKQTELGNTLWGNSATAYNMARLQGRSAWGRAITAWNPFDPKPMQFLQAMREIASNQFQQGAADQGNRLLARQGPTEVGRVIDAILARQQLRTSGHPYLAAPGIRVLGPLAGTIPAYQNPVSPQRRRQP